MRERKKKLIAAALAAVAMAAVGCSNGAVAAPAAESAPPEPIHWMVVIDPTVDQDKTVDEVLDALVGRVSFSDSLTGLFVRDRSIAQPQIWTRTYKLNRQTKQWRKDHDRSVAVDVQHLKNTFGSLRSDFAKPGRMSVARSCVLTSLSQVSRLIAKSQTRRKAYLIVVSDFLEVCPEESDTNLEQRLLLTRTLLPRGAAFSLGDVERAAFLRISSVRVSTTTEQSHLEKLWMDAARTLGLPPDRLWLGEEVSQMGEYFGKMTTE